MTRKTGRLRGRTARPNFMYYQSLKKKEKKGKERKVQKPCRVCRRRLAIIVVSVCYGGL